MRRMVVIIILICFTYITVMSAPAAALGLAASSFGSGGADKIKGLSLFTGSGFFITPSVVVTSGHIVKGSVRIEAVFNNHQVPAAVIGVDEISDLALLRVTGLEGVVVPLPLANIESIRQGDRVYTVGFPLPQVMGTQAKVSEGLISSNAGMHGDRKMYQISTPVQPGNSGGPVLNERAEVVGVVAGCLDAAAMMKQGIFPQNVNYAVKIVNLFGLLDRCGLQGIPLGGEQGPLMDAADVVEKASKAIVMLVVVKQ